MTSPTESLLANRTDGEVVREYIESDSTMPPQILTDAHRSLDSALGEAIAEYARLGLRPEEISETIAEAVFQAWAHLPDEEGNDD